MGLKEVRVEGRERARRERTGKMEKGEGRLDLVDEPGSDGVRPGVGLVGGLGPN